MTEADLVRRCLAGEAEAFGALVERHRDGVVGFCQHHIGDWDAAQDLAQEAFLRAYFDLHALRDPAKFGSWLRAIALRLCQSWHRRRREAPTAPDDLERCAACSGSDLFAMSVDRLVVRQALQRLPEAQRAALLLKLLGGYNLAEIAAIQSAPIETVRTRLRRARKRLKEVYGTMYEEGLPATGADGAFTRRLLEKVEIVQRESGLTWPLYACLHATRKDWSLAYVDAILGMAFRFTVDERIAETGPTDVLDWDRWFVRLAALGCDVTVFNAQLNSFSPTVPRNTEEEFRAVQAAAWDAARASIDRGVPAIAWMPITREQKAQGMGCELGLLVGYDTEKGTYDVRVPGREMWVVPWDGFGRADPVNWFNVIVFGEERPLDERQLEREALRFAVEHARSSRSGHGLDGYAVWRKALESGKLRPGAVPRAARLLREAREQAAAFLGEIRGHFPEADADLAAAADQYRQVARAWEEYSHAATTASARQALETAHVAEELAVEGLGRALGRVSPPARE